MSVLFVHKVIAAATEGGRARAARRRTLFRSVGVDPEMSVDPGLTIPDTDFFALLERVVHEDEGGRAIPVRVGASMRCDDYGAFGLAFKSAPDLLGSYRRVERYGKIITSVANFRVVARGGTVRMAVISERRARLGLALTNELAVAAATALSREVSRGAFDPTVVRFSHAAPEDDTEQRAYFRCPIRYGSDLDALETNVETLRLPNRLGDPGIAAFLDTHLDRELDDVGARSDLTRRVLDHVGELLSEGVPVLARVAVRLGMSDRTLQRRLAEADVAYRDLVAEARRGLAEELLRRTDYALAEIAFLTGFSDQSTFTRAFKRWTGQTPASYRREA